MSGPSISAEEKDRVLNMLFGFFDVHVLQVGIDQGVFEKLAAGPLSTQELSEACGIPPRSLSFLVISMVSLDLVAPRADGKFELTEFARKFMLAASAVYQGGYVKLASWAASRMDSISDAMKADTALWDGFSHYLDEEKRHHEIDETNRQKAAVFNAAMAASSIFVTEAVLRAVDLRGRKHLLDIGGGYGQFARTAVLRTPGLTASVVDLPQVCDEARPILRASEVRDRVTMVPGDFIHDPFPGEPDVISFIRIFNARPDDTIRDLLARAYAKLPSGGLIVISSAPILESASARHLPQAARLAMLHWAAAFKARAHYMDEYAERLKVAGFSAPTISTIDDPYGILAAVKP